MGILSKKSKSYALQGGEKKHVLGLVQAVADAQRDLGAVLTHIASREGIDLAAMTFDIGQIAFIPKPEPAKA